jgi:redox-sensitive bicupin YhaK (pirin superfamily)
VTSDARYVYFLDDDAFQETDRTGFRRRVISGGNLQLCFWRIADQAVGSFIHRHDGIEQLGIVFRGSLDFRIGTDKNIVERTVLGSGDVYIAGSGIWHGDSVFHGDEEYGECWILDVFVPPRPDLEATG